MTNEQIAEQYACGLFAPGTRHTTKDAVQRQILAAIRESQSQAAPVWDEAKVVDWPTEPGLWMHDCGTLRWVVASRAYSQATRAHCITVHADYGLVDRRGKFCGPFTPPLPSPPAPAAPSPWDYEPKDGDYVWVHLTLNVAVDPDVQRIYEKGGKLFASDYREECGAVDEMRRNGYCFALARVEPPPEVQP